MAQNIKNIELTGSFTRPANTTAYAAEDVVGTDPATLITFTPSSDFDVNQGQSMIIKSVKLTTDNSTITNGSFRLYFLDSTQTAITDNSAQTLLYTNRNKRIGYVDLTLATGGSGSDCGEAYSTDVNIPVKINATDLYGYLVATAAYTPASAQNFNIELICHLIDG